MFVNETLIIKSVLTNDTIVVIKRGRLVNVFLYRFTIAAIISKEFVNICACQYLCLYFYNTSYFFFIKCNVDLKLCESRPVLLSQECRPAN